MVLSLGYAHVLFLKAQRRLPVTRSPSFEGESRLSELLHDPIIRLLMRRDGVSEEDLQRFLQIAATRMHKIEEAARQVV